MPDNLDLYEQYLRFSGMRVITATNGAEAIEQAQKHRPDVVVMDMSLPVMDGWEATRTLKADPKTRSIRFIALTGHVEANHRERCFEAGCDEFLPKPCLPQMLVESIHASLKKCGKKY